MRRLFEAILSLLLLLAHSGGSLFLKSALELPESDETVFVLLPINLLGMANRLRTMASLYSVLVRLRNEKTLGGRAFVLLTIWESTSECPVEYADIFLPHTDENVRVESFATFMDSEADPLISFETNIRRHVSSILATLPASRGGVYSGEVFPRRGLLEEGSLYPLGDAASGLNKSLPIVLTVWTRGSHSLRAMSCKDFIFTKSLFYQGLEPVLAITSTLKKYKFEHYSRGRNVIGVHVRAFDSDFDWAVVSPHAASVEKDFRARSLRFDEASPLEGFVELMAKILSFEPATVFFVASNSAVAKQTLVNYFPNNVVVLFPDTPFGAGEYRNSFSGMIHAVTEFYLLGDATTIVHSRGSSFGREAAFRLMRPVIDVQSKAAADLFTAPSFVYFYSLNMAVSSCALPEYIREEELIVDQASAIGREIDLTKKKNIACFIEEGDRTMCTALYQVCLCHKSGIDAIGWEVSVLHCYVPDASGIEESDCTTITAESNGYSLHLS